MRLVEGQVFHVTKVENWPKIIRADGLLPNLDDSFATTFGSSKNSFFRRLGCVSLFDWRDQPNEEIDVFRRRCWPFQAAKPGGDGVIFMLAKQEIYGQLVSWKKWQEARAFDQMIVPFVETGFPGKLSLDHFKRFALYKCKPEKPGSLADIVASSFGPR